MCYTVSNHMSFRAGTGKSKGKWRETTGDHGHREIILGQNPATLSGYSIERLEPLQASCLGNKNTSDTDVYLPYKQAGFLHKAGVNIGFCYQGDMEAMYRYYLSFEFCLQLK